MSHPTAADVPAPRSRRGLAAKAGLVTAGVLAGGVLATSLAAGAATPSPTPAASGSATTVPQQGTQPGVGETDGIPESQEHHGGVGGHGGHGLDLSGTVTAVTGSSITIKTATATTTYAVTSASDIDKNGEAKLSELVVGDAVTFSATTSGTTQTIDKLHAGDEAKDRPQAPAGTTTTPGGYDGSAAGGSSTPTN